MHTKLYRDSIREEKRPAIAYRCTCASLGKQRSEAVLNNLTIPRRSLPPQCEQDINSECVTRDEYGHGLDDRQFQWRQDLRGTCGRQPNVFSYW